MTDKVEAVQAEETPAAVEAVKNPLEKSVNLIVKDAELKAKMDAELKRIAKKAKMPGFRTGRVPFNMVAAQYSAEVYSNVMNDLVRAAYIAACEEAKLEVAGVPTITDDGVDEEGNMKFVATVECMPEFELPNFAELEVKKFTCEVAEADVAKTIEIMRKQRATYVEEEGRKAADGDKVTLNFVGTKDGVAFEGGSADGFSFVLAEGRMLPEFEAGVTGCAAGDKNTFDLTFPENYSSKELAGQKVQFAIEVTKVEKAVLPEVNEEFATSLGLNSLEEMNAELRRNIDLQVKERIAAKNRQAMTEFFGAQATFQVPAALVQDEQNAMAERAKADWAMRTGTDPKTAPALPTEFFAKPAEQSVRVRLFVSKIIAANELNVTEEEIRAQAAEVASMYEQPEEVVENIMGNEDSRAAMADRVLENKVFGLIYSQAKVTEEAVSFDNLTSMA